MPLLDAASFLGFIVALPRIGGSGAAVGMTSSAFAAGVFLVSQGLVWYRRRGRLATVLTGGIIALADLTSPHLAVAAGRTERSGR